MTRAAATAYAISLAREHLGDYVPTADVTLTTSREPTTAMGGRVQLVVTLTVVVDDPDAAVEAQHTAIPSSVDDSPWSLS
jgi:hypothetical protein